MSLPSNVAGPSKLLTSSSKLSPIVGTPATQLRLITENNESPRSEHLDFMRATQVNDGIRPNSTSNSQASDKRKFEELELNDKEPVENKQLAAIKEPVARRLQYAHRRYDFYKTHDPNFNSPDPRQKKNPEEPIVETQCILECSSQKEMDYEDPNKDSTQSSFDELLKYVRKPTKKPPPKPLFQQLMEEKPSKKEINRHESQQMVEWVDVPDLMSIPPRTHLLVESPDLTGADLTRADLTGATNPTSRRHLSQISLINSSFSQQDIHYETVVGTLSSSLFLRDEDVDDIYEPLIENAAENESVSVQEAIQGARSNANTSSIPLFNVVRLVDGMQQKLPMFAVLLKNPNKNPV